MNIPTFLKKFCHKLQKISSYKQMLFHVMVITTFSTNSLSYIDDLAPKDSTLQNEQGYIEECWIYRTRFKKRGQNKLFLKLNGNFLSLIDTSRNNSLNEICDTLKINQSISIKVFFEKTNGTIWDLQQGNSNLVQYNEEIYIKKNLIIIKFLMINFINFIMAWIMITVDIIPTMYSQKIKRK